MGDTPDEGNICPTCGGDGACHTCWGTGKRTDGEDCPNLKCGTCGGRGTKL